MTRQRWQSHGLRSVRRWHRLPCVEVRGSLDPLQPWTSGRRFLGLTWIHATRRANRWLYR